MQRSLGHPWVDIILTCMVVCLSVYTFVIFIVFFSEYLTVVCLPLCFARTDSSARPVAHPSHRVLRLDGNQDTLACTLAGSGAWMTCTCNAGSSGPRSFSDEPGHGSFNCTACVAGKYKSSTACLNDYIYNIYLVPFLLLYTCFTHICLISA
jgi:hypothetical protein